MAGQQADFAFEATTGWRFVAEEVMGAGCGAHLAEPADTRALRGHGLPERSWLLTDQGRAWLAGLELSTVARQTVDLALRMIDFLDTELDQLDATLAHIARGQPGCQALMGRYGIGWPGRRQHLGRVRRPAPVRQRPPSRPFTGLDITVAASDTKRARGHLARQGPPVLRWALHEAARWPPARVRPTTPTTCRSERGWAAALGRQTAGGQR